MNFSNIRIVLVETSHPGNIGATARAMKNMGLDQLILVQPKSFPHAKATERAAGADDILATTQVVATLEQAIADCHLVLGSSARNRALPWPLLDPHQAAKTVQPASATAPVAIVFGREKTGLYNDELQQCQYHIMIPANPAYSSLNLAAAVQVICYELRMYAQQACDTEVDAEHMLARPSQTDLARFYAELERALIQIDFMNPHIPGHLMGRLRRLFTRAQLETKELAILRGIVAKVQTLANTTNKN